MNQWNPLDPLVVACYEFIVDVPNILFNEEEPGPNDDGSVTVVTPFGAVKTYSSTGSPPPDPGGGDGGGKGWFRMLMEAIKQGNEFSGGPDL